MRTLLLTFSSLLIITVAQAQQTEYKNSFHLGADYLGLPDNVGIRYSGKYAKHLSNDRLVVSLSGGYLDAPNPRYLTGTNVKLHGRRIKRITTDATFSFDFLRSSRHALRLGVGPSVWYCEDETMGAASYTIRGDGSITNIKVAWEPSQGVNVGFHVITEYEYWFTRHTTLGSQVGLASLRNSGGLTGILGLTVGHRF